MEIIDGCLWITYTNDPENPVNLGTIYEKAQGTEGLAYYPLPDGTYGVKAGTTLYLSHVEIPTTYNGKAVTQILSDAFTGAVNLTSISIPDSITTICDSAFYGCTGLTSITIPDSVTNIGEWAFYGCSSLTSLVIPKGVTSIDAYTFYGCSGLTSITIPDSVVFIDTEAFYGSPLNSITYEGTMEQWKAVVKAPDWVPESLLFIACTDGIICLTHDVVTDASVAPTCTEFGLTEGSHCSRCDEVFVAQETIDAPGHAYESVVTPPKSTEDGYTTYTCSVCGDTYTEAIIPVAFTVTVDNREQVGYTEESNGNLIIPAIFRAEDGTWYRTTAIGEGAFSDCLDLISVEIPQTVTSIGAYAFSGCTALEWIRYTGNQEQWDALAKGSSWDENTGDYTFKCAPTVIDTLPFTYVVSAATGLDLTGVYFNFTATEAVTLLITIPAGTSLSTEASNSYTFDGNGNIRLPVNAGETVTLNFWSGTTIYTGVFTVAVAEPEASDDCID